MEIHSGDSRDLVRGRDSRSERDVQNDRNRHITLEELEKGLDRVSPNLEDLEILGLMQAVSLSSLLAFWL